MTSEPGNGRPDQKTCAACGARLPPDAPEGNCPECLIALAFDLPRQLESRPNRRGATQPRHFGDYELEAEIARGGMGIVYRARQISLNRVVAVKMILHGSFADGAFVRRFRGEAEAAAKLQHPNIVAIHEIGEQDGCPYFSMDFVEGRNLADLVRDHPLPVRQAARYLQSIAEAVQFAHQRGILHRDLKPSNILIDEFDQPRVTDFGLAKQLHLPSDLTMTGQLLGSPSYIPPEQANPDFGPVSFTSDVYSLGAVLYHLLAGRPPFIGETLPQIINQVVQADPVSPRLLNPPVPRDLETICLKCLAKEPERRYPSARALADDLARFLANEPVAARPASRLQRIWLWCQRRPALALLSGAFIAVVAVGATSVLWEWRRAENLAQAESNERLIAQASARNARLSLYASDMSAASLALDRGDFGLARRLLEEQRPDPGSDDLRGFEWRFLWERAQGDQRAILRGHTWTVTCAAFSPDGTLLATGSQDHSAKLWDVKRRELIANFPHKGAVCSIEFVPGGKLLMTASAGGQVQFWDWATQRPAKTFPGRVAALSPREPIVATADSSTMWWERAGPISLWNWQSGQKLGELSKPGRAMVFSPDGRWIAAGGAENEVNIWNLRTRELCRTLKTEKIPWHLAFSPDGNTLVELGWARDILVWNLRENGPPRHLRGHTLNPWSAAFSPGGKTLATCGSDQTIRLWDARTFEQTAVLRGHGGEVWCVAFSPDGKTLASGGKDQNVMFWNALAPRIPEQVAAEVGFKPVYSSNGRFLATERTSGVWGATVINLDTLRESDVLTNVLAVGFPNGDPSLLDGLPLNSPSLQTWSWADSTLQQSVPLAGTTSNQPILFGALADSGRLCFGLQNSGLVGLWSTKSGELVVSFHGPSAPIRAARVSRDGRWIAVCVERENDVHLFDAGSRAEKLLEGHHDFASDLSFAPDGKTLATGSMDGTIKLWNTTTGQETGSLPGHMQEVTDVAFSPDGRTLASIEQGHTVKVWHVPTLREVISLDVPDAGLHLQFSPDGTRLALTLLDDHIRILQAPSLAACLAPR